MEKIGSCFFGHKWIKWIKWTEYKQSLIHFKSQTLFYEAHQCRKCLRCGKIQDELIS